MEEAAAPTRRFSTLETTSGLPDDSREADEKWSQRRLHDLRARVKAARAVVSTTPGLAETLSRDWRKAAMFYARFAITEAMFRYGVSGGSLCDVCVDRTLECLRSGSKGETEVPESQE